MPIQTSQCNTDKQYSNKKIRDVENKIPDISGLVTTAALDTKIGEVENKIPDVSGLVTIAVTLKQQTLMENISLLLIIINIQMTYLIQR